MQAYRLALYLAAVLPVLAADDVASNAWDQLGRISKTQKVTVFTWDLKTYSGTIYEVTPDSLAFTENGQVTTVRRDDIWKVTKKSRVRGVLWGAAGGFAVGAPLGAVAAGAMGSHITGRDRAVGAVGFGGIGAGIGALLGLGAPKSVTLYSGKAREPVPPRTVR